MKTLDDLKLLPIILGFVIAIFPGCDRNDETQDLNIEGTWNILGAYFYADTADAMLTGFAAGQDLGHLMLNSASYQIRYEILLDSGGVVVDTVFRSESGSYQIENPRHYEDDLWTFPHWTGVIRFTPDLGPAWTADMTALDITFFEFRNLSLQSIRHSSWKLDLELIQE